MEAGCLVGNPHFKDFESYRAAVFEGRRLVRESAVADQVPLEVRAFLRADMGVALPVTVAALALRPPKGRGFTWVRTAITGMIWPLGRLHSGHVGDYVAWLVFGLSVYAAVLLLFGGFG